MKIFHLCKQEERKECYFRNQQRKRREESTGRAYCRIRRVGSAISAQEGGDYSWKTVLEEHHIFGGPNRHLSEEYGLKVYICPECHRTSARAVHQDPAGAANRYLQEAGQKAFEENFPELNFREVFGRNYL